MHSYYMIDSYKIRINPAAPEIISIFFFFLSTHFSFSRLGAYITHNATL